MLPTQDSVMTIQGCKLLNDFVELPIRPVKPTVQLYSKVAKRNALSMSNNPPVRAHSVLAQTEIAKRWTPSAFAQQVAMS